ncbi:hypothetical protein AgCh_025574 [Apium graveolens]
MPVVLYVSVVVSIVGIDDLKKEVDKRGKDEVVTSRTSQSSPRETARKGGIFTKQDIDSLFMEVSQCEDLGKAFTDLVILRTFLEAEEAELASQVKYEKVEKIGEGTYGVVY